MTDKVEDFLAHNGVVGMKWGKRKREDSGNGNRSASPQSDRSVARGVRREAKATKFDGKAAKLNTTIKDIDSQIKALPPTYRARYQRSTLLEARAELAKDRDRATKDAASVRDGKLTSTQKKVVIGASVVAGLVAAHVIATNVQSGEATRLIAKGKASIMGEKFAFKKNPTLADSDFDVNDIKRNVVKHINPDYGAIGTKMNCRRATFSYEMRRRGYDVKATKTTNANGQNTVGLLNALSPNEKIRNTSTFSVISTTMKEAGAKGKRYSAPTPVTDLSSNFAAGGKNRISGAGDSNSIFNALGKEPNGSRGEIGVMWGMGGGHSMAYEVVKGKPVIFDAQSGKVFESAEKFMKEMPAVKNAGFTRLDNVDLNVDYLMRWMTNA